MKDHALLFDDKELKQAVLLLRAVNNRPRQKILKLIHSQQMINVTAIYRQLNMTQSFASQQLGILRRAGLVDFCRRHHTVYYFVNQPQLDKLQRVAGKFLVQEV